MTKVISGQNSSWRDILLTALLASSVLYYYYFVKRNKSGTGDNNDVSSKSSNDEERRRRRRDHLAEIAEGRAHAVSAAAAAAVKHAKEKKNTVSAKVAISTTSDGDKTKTTTMPDRLSVKNAAIVDRIEKKESSHQSKTKDAKNIKNLSSLAPIEGTKTTAGSQKEGVKNDPPSNNEKESREVQTNDTYNKSKEIQVPTSIPQIIDDRPRSDATEKSKNENQRDSITIYLIKSASPRIQTTIPKNTTSSKLRQVASNVSGIPLTGLKLIFRGRVIVEKSSSTEDDDVVKEFGIQDGSAFHVVGMPTNASPSPTSSPLDQQQQQTSPRHHGDDMTSIIHRSIQDNPLFFHYAAAVGNYEVIQSAIRSGSFFTQLNRADVNGWTPLHEAVRGGYENVATLLIDEGRLNMNFITNQGYGYSPLSLAIRHHGEDHPLTRILRQRGGQEFWPVGEDNDDDDNLSESSSSDESSDDDEEDTVDYNPWRNS